MKPADLLADLEKGDRTREMLENKSTDPESMGAVLSRRAQAYLGSQNEMLANQQGMQGYMNTSIGYGGNNFATFSGISDGRIYYSR